MEEYLIRWLSNKVKWKCNINLIINIIFLYILHYLNTIFLLIYITAIYIIYYVLERLLMSCLWLAYYLNPRLYIH